MPRLALAILALAIPAAAILALAGAVPAQPFVRAHQQEDGSYVDCKGRVLVKDPRRVERTRLRTTSLMALAIMGDGSTMRSGPYKDQVKKAVRWLVKKIDDEGRIALGSHPEWFVDHALGAYAISEAARVSQYKTLDRYLSKAVGYLRGYLKRKGVTVTQELLFWGRALVESIRGCRPKTMELTMVQLQPLHDALVPHERRLAKTQHVTDLEKAMHVLRVVRFEREKTDKAVVEKLLAAAAARSKKIATMHPQAVACYSLAIYQMGGKRWKTWQKSLTEQVVKRQIQDGEARGSWRSPADAIGPMQSTAWLTLTLECYYRYIRTALVL